MWSENRWGFGRNRAKETGGKVGEARNSNNDRDRIDGVGYAKARTVGERNVLPDSYVINQFSNLPSPESFYLVFVFNCQDRERREPEDVLR